jgi:DOPA 4,5-dioxygenase
VADAADNPSTIIGWHCHIYFAPESRAAAVRLNEDVQDHFRIWDYRWLDHTNGLHPTPMFRFQFAGEDLGRFVPWITLNRAGLSIMIHAITGDDLYDHAQNAMWLGEPLKLDLEALREMQARIRRGELPAALMPATQVSEVEAGGRVRYRPGDDPHLQPPAAVPPSA